MNVVRMQLVTKSHIKEYGLVIKGNIITTAWGLMDSRLHTRITPFPNHTEAKKYFNEKIKERQNKGYEIVDYGQNGLEGPSLNEFKPLIKTDDYKDLIPIPQYDLDVINYILKVKVFVDGKLKHERTSPPSGTDYGGDRKVNLELTKLFSKYIFTTWMDDPLKCLKILMAKYPNLKWKKFISVKKETTPKFNSILNYDFEDVYFEVTYWKVREQILSYIEQKEGVSNELTELKKLFQQSSRLSFNGYLNNKSKYLMDLDLSGFTEQLNKEIGKKRKKNETYNKTPQ